MVMRCMVRELTSGADSLEVWGWGAVGREAQEGGDVLYLWLIHTVVQQKPTQHCKTIILKLKIN